MKSVCTSSPLSSQSSSLRTGISLPPRSATDAQRISHTCWHQRRKISPRRNLPNYFPRKNHPNYFPRKNHRNYLPKKNPLGYLPRKSHRMKSLQGKNMRKNPLSSFHLPGKPHSPRRAIGKPRGNPSPDISSPGRWCPRNYPCRHSSGSCSSSC